MNIQYGDIFQLGNHKLAYGDASDRELIKKIVNRDRIKLLLLDPPYGVSAVENKQGFVQFKKNKVIINDHNQSEEEYKVFTKNYLDVTIPYLEVKNSAYIFNSDKMLFALRKGMVEAGFKFSQLLIWIKNHAVMGRMNYLIQHELVVYGWYGTHDFYKSQDKSVIYYPKPNINLLHPTMKPVGLLRRLILNSTKIRDTVYDCFGGSGSTLIACEQTKRKCLMVEIDPEYCQTIINRFEKFSGLKAIKT